MGVHTFTFDLSLLENILTVIKSSFHILQESANHSQGELKRLVLTNSQHKLNLIFYKTGKGMLQGIDGDFF